MVAFRVHRNLLIAHSRSRKSNNILENFRNNLYNYRLTLFTKTLIIGYRGQIRRTSRADFHVFEEFHILYWLRFVHAKKYILANIKQYIGRKWNRITSEWIDVRCTMESCIMHCMANFCNMDHANRNYFKVDSFSFKIRSYAPSKNSFHAHILTLLGTNFPYSRISLLSNNHSTHLVPEQERFLQMSIRLQKWLISCTSYCVFIEGFFRCKNNSSFVRTLSFC